MNSHTTTHSTTPQNHVTNIAIVGVGGRCGTFIANALLTTKKHTITAITRPESTSTIPPGVHSIKVTYSDHSSLVAALTGQDVLIITMAVLAPPESQYQLIDAAIAAGVKYIIPNEWGVDLTQTQLAKETFMWDRYVPVREYIERTGGDKTHYIGVCCGFWYEFSLAGTEARYGFDFEKKTLTVYDDGTTKINTTTWPQLGRAVANLLSLPIHPTTTATTTNSPSLSAYSNHAIHISSFHLSQLDMLSSVLRVTGDPSSSWTITHEPVQGRYNRGKEMMQSGQMLGFGILLYARAFYPDGSGTYEERLDNQVLGLPVEELDEATRVAIDMAARGETNIIH